MNLILQTVILYILYIKHLTHNPKFPRKWGRSPLKTTCADSEGGSGGPDPPLEFGQKCGYRIPEWDRFDIAQHLC